MPAFQPGSVDTYLEGAVLICVFEPDASQCLLSIYYCAIYTLLYTSPCQNSATNTTTDDSDLGVVFVDDAVPWLLGHDRNDVAHPHTSICISRPLRLQNNAVRLFVIWTDANLKPLHMVKPQSNKAPIQACLDEVTCPT